MSLCGALAVSLCRDGCVPVLNDCAEMIVCVFALRDSSVFVLRDNCLCVER